MELQVFTINLGGVNCYLLKSDHGFVLVDTGFQTQRRKLEQKLEEAGCKPGNLKLSESPSHSRPFKGIDRSSY